MDMSTDSAKGFVIDVSLFVAAELHIRFYRPMLCIARSADYAVARWYPPICLSHAGIVSKRLNIHVSSNLFTIVFSVPNGMAIFHNGTSNTGKEKIVIFDKYLALSRQRYKTWNAHRTPYSSFRTLSFSMTFSDLEWLSEIFNDTKHRAVSLRQLSFLLDMHSGVNCIAILQQLCILTISLSTCSDFTKSRLRNAVLACNSCCQSRRQLHDVAYVRFIE